MKKIIAFAYGFVALLLAGYCSAGDTLPPVKPPSAQLATAIFAGGCFWCAEADFEKLAGVVMAESGYTGGQLQNPTYEQVSHGGTGHAESVRVTYNPKQVSYEKLLDYFWHHIDPTVKDQQFCDVGNQYRSAIFYQNEAQKKAAESSKAALERSGKLAHIYTEIVPASTFYPAEDYHQDYYKKNPIRYKYYRHGCGRDARVSEVWGTSH
ncbi:MAG: peptide-methionine (S)-S-oxide reductase MsrA [Methylotenera sp.]|nr:peptide-methionine (S)-S-oxide reductase MsrA [Methylotenera sp.]